MLKVYTCIATQHDLRLVALAALVCAVPPQLEITESSLIKDIGRALAACTSSKTLASRSPWMISAPATHRCQT